MKPHLHPTNAVVLTDGAAIYSSLKYDSSCEFNVTIHTQFNRDVWMKRGNAAFYTKTMQSLDVATNTNTVESVNALIREQVSSMRMKLWTPENMAGYCAVIMCRITSYRGRRFPIQTNNPLAVLG